MPVSPAQRFLEALYKGHSGVLELRTFDHPQATKLRAFIPVVDGKCDTAKVEQFLAKTKELRIGAFFGVALRSEASLTDGKGDASHCAMLTAIYVDADDKHLGREEIMRRIAAFPLRPSIIVDSGGGLHLYWKLKEGIPLTGDGMAFAKKLLRRLAAAIADVVDESVSEPVRVLRIPGGTNFKKQYDPPRPINLIIDDFVPEYTPEDFDRVLPEHAPVGDGGAFKVPKKIKPGDRHEILYKFLRSQKARGVSLEVAIAGCQKLNEEQCVPPMPLEELETYLRRVWNQDDSEAFKKEALKHDFLRDKNGAIIKDSQENIRRAIERLNYRVTYNSFAEQMLSQNGTGPAVTLNDQFMNMLWLKIDREFRFRPSYMFFEKVLQDIAHNNAFHPVVDYFASLKWDGVPRLDTWLMRLGGAIDEGSDSREGPSYLEQVSAKPMIAVVRRVRKPGSKYDEMLVLESEQGLNKSSALRALVPKEEYFSDDLPLNVDAKQVIERTLGKMIIEASELTGGRKTDRDHLKSLLSRQVDGPARLAYAHLPVERPRQFIIIGTTNSSEYLIDPTGARRFWPVRVKNFDVEGIKRERDQLWAEAAHREALGESIRLDESLWAEAGEIQEQRREVDAWEDTIKHHVEALVTSTTGRQQITIEALWNVLGIMMERRDRIGSRRIAEIVHRMGFKRMTMRVDNKVQSGYVRFVDASGRVNAVAEVVEEAPRSEDTPF